MDEITLKALAKINLGLDVVRRREDGYHEVRMIMQTIHLYDLLEIQKIREPGIQIVSNLSFLPVNENNLVYKAAKLLMDEFQVQDGLLIRLKKFIPVAAGMAGGSSDAAAVLFGVNKMFRLGLTTEQLMERGVKIGADVPYCILRGTALSEGIGEVLTKLPPVPQCQVLVAKPGINVSTKFVYENLHANDLSPDAHPDIDGMIQAIKGISFEVNQGEVIALIGANGAGKTTTLHTITGLLSPKKGSVMFEGTDITKIPAHKIVSMGMAHVPEGRRVFAELSVYENLKMGAYTRKDKNEIEESLANVYKRFPRLEERRNQMAGTLSGGEQQMLAMGRALMSKPKIILMDEPSMGLSPIFVNEIFDIIQAVSESGTTVLLVEQNAKKALSIADRAYVLETGKITMSGNAKDLLEDEAVKKAYLGE